MIRKPVSVGDEFAGDYVPERGINYDLYEPGLLESVLIFSFGGGLSVGAAFLFYNHLWAALCFSAGALPIRVLYCRYRAEKRRWQLREQFRDLLYSLSASTASGRQLDHALEEARENLRLIYPERALICMELRRLTLEVRESRVPVDQVFVSFGKRSRIEEILRFSRVCSLCRRMGGDM
ncbi:MAG: hypothetical protein IJO79_01605, partial [Firmicutes bacterium]|nr:hypothetical protein [Bacillota bacterium]